MKRVVIRFLQGDTRIFNATGAAAMGEMLTLKNEDDEIAQFPLAAIAGWWFETSVAQPLKGK